LQGNDAAVVCWWIIDDIGEVAVKRDEDGIEILGLRYDFRIGGVRRQVSTQQLEFDGLLSAGRR
jgi:hypothetical protein